MRWLLERITAEQQEEMCLLAIKASFEAENHRKFNVGSAVLAANQAGDIRLFHGANCMPRAHGTDGSKSHRCCAEAHAMQAALNAGYTIFLALAVAAPRQTEGASGIEVEFTPPCLTCRIELHSSPHVVGHDMPVWLIRWPYVEGALPPDKIPDGTPTVRRALDDIIQRFGLRVRNPKEVTNPAWAGLPVDPSVN